jgi:hypothetical protein
MLIRQFKVYKKHGYDIVNGIKWEGWNISDLKEFLGDHLLDNPDKQKYFNFVSKDDKLDIYLKNENEPRQKICLRDVVIRDRIDSCHFKILKEYETMDY